MYNHWRYTQEQKDETWREHSRRCAAIMQKIVETLRAKGAEVTLIKYAEGDTLTHTDFDIDKVNGERINWELEVKLETCFPDSPKEWAIGRCSRFTIEWREHKFIEGKAGFKYDEIADCFIRVAQKDKDNREKYRKLELAGVSSQQIRARLDEDYPFQHDKKLRVEACQVMDRVNLHVGKMLTIDEAIGLLTVLKGAGADTKIGFQIVHPVTEPVALAALNWSNPKNLY